MKQILFFLCLCVSVYAGTMRLSKEKVNEMIEQRERFFTNAFLVPYDTENLSLDSDKKLVFIDLCKYRAKGYQFPCGKRSSEEVGIRKYFIKATSIEEAYHLFETQNELSTIPKSNLYDYGEAESNKDDEVGSYYIWDTKGRFWVIAMGYDSGSITIYTQSKDYIEVIYQWSVDW